ncbi:MAG: glutamate synthase large subunit [Lentisphaeria bacterium]|nr:glutamate synthase large subunit [Lentisphaeria bacterium]
MKRQLFQAQPAGLYRPEDEHDACGVGLVADLGRRASHRIVEQGITILRRLMHRGAAGSDPETGDGAGLLLALPDAFFRRVVPEELPAPGKYAVAMLFGGIGAEAEIEKIVAGEGGRVICRRQVPLRPECIGRKARETVPVIRQLFIDGSSFADQGEFERKLFVMRRLAEKLRRDLYICSMSSRTIVYKGLLLATQLEGFYPDLSEPDFSSPLVLVHQRYSTNTFPDWRLAHPFRYLAHNGEINTLRGNLNALKLRESSLESPLFGEDLAKLLPLIDGDAPTSDSAALDNMLELLVASGRSLEHAMLMLLPQAWGEKYYMGRDVRNFFEYHSALMEPWDGPAAVVFSDGINAGAMLDRNGLRPVRFTVSADGTVVLASETGVLDIDPAETVTSGRLRPGEMLFLDLENHRIIPDAELKNRLARSKPYRRWVEENRITVRGLFTEITSAEPEGALEEQQKLFGWTREDVELILSPMAEMGLEPIGSMGGEAAFAALSKRPRLLFDYFRQLFAQVTNPPVDPIREELVMSLMTYIGNRGDILGETPEHARLVKLRRPILTDAELEHLQTPGTAQGSAAVLLCGFPVWGGGEELRRSLRELACEAVREVRAGSRILILSDRALPVSMAAIPPLLALSAVNRALIDAGVRSETGIIVQSGEVREIMHFALLLGFGATAVNPYLALQTVTELARSGKIACDAVSAASNYIRAVDKGLLKTMSKLGICTLRSYRSSRSFAALGLSREFLEEFLPGVVSPVSGIGIDRVAADAAARARSRREPGPLERGGICRFTPGGEEHLWTPKAVALLRQAVRENDLEKFEAFSALADENARVCTLRGQLEFAPAAPIPPDEVESEEEVMKHFAAGAMSLGSLSPEAHETIASGANGCGAMSNCGEGGENRDRFHTPFSCAVKQVASGRFGVTIDYLVHARELQIKMAQGAKPGEGGHLPGDKVNSFVAGLRHSLPGVSLISPPPHHDIYSIEDLSQLIFDLRCANPEARISVKLVSEPGIGPVAAGVAKAHADAIVISGGDGGTGAAPLTGLLHAGFPWETGLAEARQTLVLNNLRKKVRLQIDGGLRTARDVVAGALLGAEEFAFGTALLITLGCVMDRKCACNTCPAGIATQDPELRKRFAGKPEHIANFFRLLARSVRAELAALGLHSLAEACGRTDLLRQKEETLRTGLDLRPLLEKVSAAPGQTPASERNGAENFDRTALLGKLKLDGSPETLELKLDNTCRSVGTALSGIVSRKTGGRGFPDDTVTLNFTGVAGQSFGAFLAPGITLNLAGSANDFAGKGLSGGKIIIKVPDGAAFPAEKNVIAGNVVGYGGTSGRIFINGLAGERFAVRNSGMICVAEGVGDHGCEYMTGGRAVILGPAGVNFGAGMTGGIAYVYDEAGDFDLACNMESVDLESVEPGSDAEKELRSLIEEHFRATGSARARRFLAEWPSHRPRFVRVFPVEYRQALAKEDRIAKQS